MKKYFFEEVYNSTLNYFNGDKLATDTWIKKYCLKTLQGEFLEKNPNDMHKRISKEFSRIEQKYKNPLSEEKIFELLKNFKYIVPQGSPMEGIGNNNKYSTLSNCYVIHSPRDSYSGILTTEREMIELYKRRGGVGTSLETLRSKHMPTSSVSEKSSGVVLFAERYSNTTREVAQDGRRGALMLSLNISHPDIEYFIDSKLEEDKITGANISVKIDDKFMKAVINDEEYELHFEGIIDIDKKKVRAKKIWDKIIKNAWEKAEPGVLFWDTILSESPANKYGSDWVETSTNPCFTADTIIAVADGRNGVSIKDLCDTNFPVYSARLNKSSGNNSGGWKTQIKQARAFKTGYKKIITIKLSDGSEFRCTPDHLLALPNEQYIEARNSKGVQLEKFYTFSNKNNNKSYRVINSKSNRYNRQYRMLWEYYNGKYDGKEFNIDHIDNNSTNDLLSNLKLLTIEEHKIKTDRFGKNNPIHKANKELIELSLLRKNILANSKKYSWSEEREKNELKKFDEKYGERLFKLQKKKDLNVYLDEQIYVEDIIDNNEFEDVYDLTVEDNHNFYILTKTDDDKFLNSSGCLVHNCSELPLPPYDSCRLLLLNLYSYVDSPFTKNAIFNIKKFKEHTRIAQRLLDDIVDLEIEKINRILDKLKNDPDTEDDKSVEINMWNKIKGMAIHGRRTGLGITALGDMLAALNLKYGTKNSTQFIEEIFKTFSLESYKSSIDLAEERGHFNIWKKEIEWIDENSPFVNRVLDNLPDDYLEKYYKYGRRNISNLTIAPAGSVSIMTQTTSGIEPVFKIYYNRNKKVTNNEPYDFKDKKGDKWQRFNVLHPKFIEWFKINYWNGIDISKLNVSSPKEWLEQCSEELLNKYIEVSPYYLSEANDIDWVEKVNMQGKIQKFIDHSISVTVNLPNSVDVKTVEDIYFTAWKSGCKGITVYRDGCRTGVLTSKKEEDSNIFNYVDAVKRPKIVECDIYHKQVLKQEMLILVGKVQNKPIEIFAFKNGVGIPDKCVKGKIIKHKKRNYELITEYNGKEYKLDNIIDYLEENEQNETRQISTMLRHRIHPKFIVQQLETFATITSQQKAMSRVLQNYIKKDDINKEEVCKICGGELKYEGGCVQCTVCGWSACN